MRTGLVLVVEQAAPLVRPWASTLPHLGVPPHVTALYPWLDDPEGPDLARLHAVARGVRPLALELAHVGRFPPAVLHLGLAPASDRRVRELTRALVEAFPTCLPYGGEHPDPVPHLTVALGTPAELDEVERRLVAAGGLPVRATAAELTVMEERPDDSWARGAAVPLGGPA